ncbi:MAG: DNA/RNA nuclease SfsA [Thermoplasmataceae archaeon]
MGFTVYTFRESLFTCTVIDRPNRFVVNVSRDGERLKCHLHDPGRLKELIYEGAKVLVRPSAGDKTKYSITAASENSRWIVTDTRIHSEIASLFINHNARREVSVGRKRIDFLHGNHYIEVKGCTLVVDGTARFPDAPTKRGKQHLDLLAQLVKEGHEATVVVLVMRDDVSCFMPNADTDPDFARSFSVALAAGVGLKILKFSLAGNSVVYRGEISLCADHGTLIK